MTSSVDTGALRLMRAQATPRQRHVAAALAVATIAATAIGGWWSVPIALLAAGAGAGYSLSGSV